MRALATGLAVFFCLSTSGFAQIQYGEEAGELTLHGLGDYRHTLNNYAERPATAIVFLSARCPVVEANYERIREIHHKYRRKDVLYVGIVSDPDQSVDEIRDFMQTRGIIFPVYRDPDGKIRERFGASVTPELFLLDREGKLTYHGGPDRDQSFQSLELAILSILLNAPAEVEDIPPHGTWGEIITWLNSDATFYDSTCVRKGVEYLIAHPETGIVFGVIRCIPLPTGTELEPTRPIFDYTYEKMVLN